MPLDTNGETWNEMAGPQLIETDFGNGWMFDGSRATVMAPDFPDLSDMPAFTLTLRIKITDHSGWNPIIGCMYTASGIRRGWGIWRASGSQRIHWSFSSGTMNSNVDWAYDEWYHLAIVVKNGGMTMYQNGQPAGSKSGAISSALPVTIGGWQSNGETFSGAVDDIHVFDTALAQDEIKSLLGLPTELELGVDGALAPFWADMEIGEAGTVYTQAFAESVVVQWDAVTYSTPLSAPVGLTLSIQALEGGHPCMGEYAAMAELVDSRTVYRCALCGDGVSPTFVYWLRDPAPSRWLCDEDADPENGVLGGLMSPTEAATTSDDGSWVVGTMGYVTYPGAITLTRESTAPTLLPLHPLLFLRPRAVALCY